MRVVLLTSVERGFASLCLPELVRRGIDVPLVIVADPNSARRSRTVRRLLKKVMKIGVFGALNGVRMRGWYDLEVARLLGCEPIDEVARQERVGLVRTPAVNSDETVQSLTAADADLAVSLGNGYIAPRVFDIPRHGMINVHHELLPDYRGAQSVIWQLHDGSRESGFTIHQIDRDIDGGPILYRQKLPIELHQSLRDTVIHNCAKLWRLSAEVLPDVIARYAELRAKAVSQRHGRSFTTPTLTQYLRMVRQHKKAKVEDARSLEAAL